MRSPSLLPLLVLLATLALGLTSASAESPPPANLATPPELVSPAQRATLPLHPCLLVKADR